MIFELLFIGIAAALGEKLNGTDEKSKKKKREEERKKWIDEYDNTGPY